MIKFMLITNDPELGEYAESCGVSRIFVDLEVMGKQERQGHLDTLISQHSLADIAKVKSKISCAELLVRLNPLHSGTAYEIDESIKEGADLLMLPMFKSASEVRQFCGMVNGRVGVIPLLETYSAAKSLNEIVRIPGITEIYIGLNDLHLDMNLKFMFEPLANGFLDELVSIIKSSGLPYGFGGIARVGEGIVPGEMVLAEHIRLGSSSVILSRTFHRKSESVAAFKKSLNLKIELEKLREVEQRLMLRTAEKLEEDKDKFRDVVKQFVADKK